MDLLLTRRQDHVHVQREGVVGETVLPGHVPQVVLRVLVTCPPLGVVRPAVHALHQSLQEVSVIRAGDARLDVDVGGPWRLVDWVDQAPGDIVSHSGVAGSQVGDVELSHVKLLVRDKHHHRHGAVPSGGALHQPVEPLHRGLCAEGDPGEVGEL